MSQFENVTVVKAANVYFDGTVISRTVRFADGSEKTPGFMQPGNYELNTAQKENMEIMAGELDVPANSTFRLSIKHTTDYCCSYID